MTGLAPLTPEVRGNGLSIVQDNCQTVWLGMNFTAQFTSLVEGLGFQDDQPLVAMDQSMLRAMGQPEIGSDGDLKRSTVSMMNPTTLLQGMLVMARRMFTWCARGPVGQ